jgi:hypothetical protein
LRSPSNEPATGRRKVLRLRNMIINAKTVVITLSLIALASYLGLRAIRAFALSIAQENHDAVAAMDAKEELDRAKRLRLVNFVDMRRESYI